MKYTNIIYIICLCALTFACSEYDAGLKNYPSVDEESNDVILDDEENFADNGYVDKEYKTVDRIYRVDNPNEIMVAAWPGIPGDSVIEPRLADVEVHINATYSKRDANDRIGVGNTPWFSTGLYAAPAEIISIRKPASLNGKKVTVRIGASNCTLGEKQKPWLRLPKTFETKVLKDNDTTQLFNYSGGNIYIIPDQPFEKPELFVINGAIKSPDFVLGKTDPKKWKEAIVKTTVPFAELIGRKTIWTMPTGRDYLGAVEDPIALAEFYDDAVENDFNAFHGLTSSSFDRLHRAPTFAHRHVPDIQVCAGAAHAGYPCMYGMNYASRGVKLEMMRTTNNAWGFYHELGHNYQNGCWKWLDGPGSIGEVSNNLHIMHSRTRTLGRWHLENDNEYQPLIDQYVLIEDSQKNFDAGQTDLYGEILNKTSIRQVPFAQLAAEYGWRLYAYLGKKSRELPSNVASIIGKSPAVARRDFFCISASEYAGVNLMPFFDAWGIKYTNNAKLDMQKLPDYIGDKFWEKFDLQKLPSFKERIPLKVDEFRYGLADGEINRYDWEVIDGYHTGNMAESHYIFDGNVGTSWGSGVVTRPILNYYTTITIDMKYVNYINYIIWQHRDFYMRMACKRFKLEYKENEEDEWGLMGEYETQDIKPEQKIMLGDSFSAQYLKITFLEGHHEGGNTTGSIVVAEFKAGYQDNK